jgi:hypothetical protein
LARARFGGLLLFACLAPAAPAQDAANGRSLYRDICARCHSDPPGSGSINPLVRTADEIRAAINRVSPMGFLSSLTDRELQDIAAYFVTVLGEPTFTPDFNVGGQWYDVAQPWWALQLTQFAGRKRIAGTWYTFDADSKPTWLYFYDGGEWSGPGIYTSKLYRNSGPPFATLPDLQRPAPEATPAGDVALVFSNRDSADVTFILDGVRITRKITRFNYPR